MKNKSKRVECNYYSDTNLVLCQIIELINSFRGDHFKLQGGKRFSAIERWAQKVLIDPSEGCWNWQGSKPQTGYGEFKAVATTRDTKKTSPHRFIWSYLNGYVAAEEDIDHTCHNRACCNPDHLEEKTHQENMTRRRKPRPKEELDKDPAILRQRRYNEKKKLQNSSA